MRPRHLASTVHDLAAARAFYGELLGCPEGRSAETWIDFDLYGRQIIPHLDPDKGDGGGPQPRRRVRRAGPPLRRAGDGSVW
jgi:uncharacterized protein